MFFFNCQNQQTKMEHSVFSLNSIVCFDFFVIIFNFFSSFHRERECEKRLRVRRIYRRIEIRSRKLFK